MGGFVASGVATVLVENAVPSERIGSREYELSYLFKRIVSPPKLNLPTPLLGHSLTCNLVSWNTLTINTQKLVLPGQNRRNTGGGLVSIDREP